MTTSITAILTDDSYIHRNLPQSSIYGNLDPIYLGYIDMPVVNFHTVRNNIMVIRVDSGGAYENIPIQSYPLNTGRWCSD